MALLWPELGTEAAAANLRKAVHFARRGLGDKESIAADGDMLTLWPADGLSVDVDSFEAAAAMALATGAGTEAALELFTADLLPEDRYAEWTEPHRQRLRDCHLKLLRAAGRWEQVLEIDRTDEEACRALMRAHLDLGNRQGAVRQFQRLRVILRVDLGVGPEPATVALFEQAVATSGPQAPDAAENVQALLGRGLVLWNQGELDAAQRLAEEARALAEHHRLGRELGESSTLLGMVAMARGRWPEVFRQEFAGAVQLGVDQAPFVMEGHVCLAEASLNGADSKSISELAHELLPLAIDAASVPGEALMCLLIGESELLSGRLDESREWLSRAAGLYGDMDRGSGQAFALLKLTEVATAREQTSEAARHLAAARKVSEVSDLASHLLIRIFELAIKLAGTPERRQQVLSDVEELLRRPREVCGPCSIGCRVAAAIACAQAGDAARSREWLAGAEHLAGMWQGGPWQAAVWEARAALRLAEGDRTQAAALLREATTLFAQSGRPLDEARCASATASLR